MINNYFSKGFLIIFSLILIAGFVSAVNINGITVCGEPIPCSPINDYICPENYGTDYNCITPDINCCGTLLTCNADYPGQCGDFPDGCSGTVTCGCSYLNSEDDGGNRPFVAGRVVAGLCGSGSCSASSPSYDTCTNPGNNVLTEYYLSGSSIRSQVYDCDDYDGYDPINYCIGELLFQDYLNYDCGSISGAGNESYAEGRGCVIKDPLNPGVYLYEGTNNDVDTYADGTPAVFIDFDDDGCGDLCIDQGWTFDITNGANSELPGASCGSTTLVDWEAGTTPNCCGDDIGDEFLKTNINTGLMGCFL